MNDFIALFILILPIFIIIFVGLFLRLTGVVDDHFNRISNKIVFNVALPVFIFQSLAQYDFSQAFDYKLILYTSAGTLTFFVLAWIIGSALKLKSYDMGVFVQGSFRGNYAIVGLAIILSVAGESQLQKAAILLAFALPLFNILSVIALSYPNKETDSSYIKQIITNPLILAVVASLPFNFFNIHLPMFIGSSINYLSALTLPLALINIGASMHFESFRYPTLELILASSMKALFQPLLFTLLGIFLGFPQDDLIQIFVFFSVPTAIASYVMSDAMGRNSKFAGNIIIITTLVSIITMPVGIYLIHLL